MKWILFVLYVALMVSMGYLGMKKTKNLNDFFIGGRAVGPWLSAFAFGTAYFSAVLFVGYAGKNGWDFGLSDLWIVVGNAVLGTYLSWKVLAKKTRQMTERLGSVTMPGFLAARYESPGLKIVGALIIFIFLVPYTASVYMGLTYLFESLFGVSYNYALLFMAALTAIYITMGGYLAMTLNDLIQGIIMIFGVIIMVYFVTQTPQVGGIIEGYTRLKAQDPSLVTVTPNGFMKNLMLFSLVILTSLGSWAMPKMVQKFYAIKDEASIKPATIISTLFTFFVSLAAYYTGTLSHLFFNKLPLGPDGKPTPDLLMPMILAEHVPETVAALILLLILSASMSTLSSLVLVSSSVITVDLVQESLYPGISKKNAMLLSRILCVVFITISVIMALKPTLILTLMALAWGAVNGAFLAPYVLGLYMKSITKAGAWAGMITGVGIMIIGPNIFGAKFIPVIGCAAMLLPLVVVPLVSKFTEPFSQKHILKVFGSQAISTQEGKSEVA